MRLYYLIALFLAIICLIAEVSTSCSCGAVGREYCSCQSQFPRPAPRRVVDNSQSYQPIGDSCSCGHTVVQPATPPKPVTNTIRLEPSRRTSCQEKTMRAPESFQGPNVNPNLVYGNKPEQRPLPADAVSLSLAYQLARSLRRPVPEDKIQYGFRIQPINGAQKKVQNNVPEEKLWSVNRAIVELKASSIPSNPQDEDDEDEAAEEEARSPGYLTYGDIGYCPEKLPEKAFNIKLPAVPYDHHCSNNPVPNTAYKNCGYKPGRIAISYQADIEKNDYRGLEDCVEEN